MGGRTSQFNTGTRQTSSGGALALAKDRLGSNPRSSFSQLCDFRQVILSAGTSVAPSIKYKY